MCDLVEEGFIGEILGDELRKRIPEWFNKNGSGLLINALVNAELEEEMEILVNLIKPRVSSKVKEEVSSIPSGKVEKVSQRERVNIKKKIVNTLDTTIDKIKGATALEIEGHEIRISVLTKELNKLKKEVKRRKGRQK